MCTGKKNTHNPLHTHTIIFFQFVHTCTKQAALLFLYHGSPPVSRPGFLRIPRWEFFGKNNTRTEQQRREGPVSWWSCVCVGVGGGGLRGGGGSVTEALILNFKFCFAYLFSRLLFSCKGRMSNKQGMWSSFPSGEAQAPEGDCRLRVTPCLPACIQMFHVSHVSAPERRREVWTSMASDPL